MVIVKVRKLRVSQPYFCFSKTVQDYGNRSADICLVKDAFGQAGHSLFMQKLHSLCSPPDGRWRQREHPDPPGQWRWKRSGCCRCVSPPGDKQHNFFCFYFARWAGEWFSLQVNYTKINSLKGYEPRISRTEDHMRRPLGRATKQLAILLWWIMETKAAREQQNGCSGFKSRRPCELHLLQSDQ